MRIHGQHLILVNLGVGGIFLLNVVFAPQLVGSQETVVTALAR